jgi:hypothetical protein
VNTGKTSLDVADELVLYIFDFLSGEDRLKVELCLNRRLNPRVFYKLLIEEQRRDEKHVVDVTMKLGDIWWQDWDRRREIKLRLTTVNSDVMGVHTIVRWTHSLNCPPYQSRKIVTFPDYMNMTTRGATRRVIRLLGDGRFDLWDHCRSQEIRCYDELRKRRWR